MSDGSRYLNADEARAVQEYAQQYRESPPATADPIMDELDRGILKSESFPTLETTNALAFQRNREHAQRAQHSPISVRVQNAIAADDAMAERMRRIES